MFLDVTQSQPIPTRNKSTTQRVLDAGELPSPGKSYKWRLAPDGPIVATQDRHGAFVWHRLDLAHEFIRRCEADGFHEWAETFRRHLPQD